jgi:two-component system, LytTR family, response regulator
MIRAIIIDDELNNIENLAALLAQHCPSVEITGRARNAAEGAMLTRQLQPDLVFLDIEMPGRNGFEMLQSLNDFSFEVIFVTAFEQYGIQAIKFSALDYLLKPVSADELKQAVDKAIAKRQKLDQNLQLENLLQLLRQEQKRSTHRIALATSRETRFIETGQIIRCASSNNYTTFFLKDGEKILTSKPIFEYENMLTDYGFFRCHQRHLINRQHIKSYVNEDGGYLLMEDNSSVPVSRSKKESLKELFNY